MGTPKYYQNGDLGTKVLQRTKAAEWEAGSEVEITWSIAANHGGGYQYRLCPASEELSEECFQRMPLDFVRGSQKYVFPPFDEEKIAYVENPVYVSGSQVLPVGSTWVRNTVIIPSDLAPGAYVLGWRWDCEGTAQVWSNC